MIDELQIDRKKLAEELHAKVLERVNNLRERWYDVAEVLHPIWENDLYKELGFKSWGDYVQRIVKEPVQTLNNYLTPYRKLLESGLDPKVMAEVPLSAAGEISTIAKANGGKIDESLVEQAKNANTHEKKRAFREAIHLEKAKLGIESPRTINLIVPESLYDLWNQCLQIIADENGEQVMDKHKNMLLEAALAEYMSRGNNEELQ